MLTMLFSSPFGVIHFLTGDPGPAGIYGAKEVLVPFRGYTFLNPVPGNQLK